MDVLLTKTTVKTTGNVRTVSRRSRRVPAENLCSVSEVAAVSSSSVPTPRDAGKPQPPPQRHPTTTLEIFVCPKANGRFADDNNCRNYWQCKNGEPTLKACPGPVMVFNAKRSHCDLIFRTDTKNCSKAAAPALPWFSIFW
ncbi:hypothetical protein HDE_06940 [Halotydeus destructor]|nr:hypothetical protein HDE_06940 [Halotydeus destructor]